MSDFLWNAIVLIVSLGILILVHEWGHFMVAKRSKIGVLEFAIGMGPILFSIQRGETRYSIRAIPLGGFCRMEGEDEKEDGPGAFHRHSKTQRFLTLVAGGMMNLILGFWALCLLFSLRIPYLTSTVETVLPGSTAESVGIFPGDRIVAINEVPVQNATDVSEYLYDHADQVLSLTLCRGEETRIINDVVLTIPMGEEYTYPMLGVTWKQEGMHLLESTVVDEVRRGSVAEAAGLRSGDRIVAIDGSRVHISQDLNWRFSRKGYEDYSLTVLRDGKEVEISGLCMEQHLYESADYSYTRSSLGYTLQSEPQTAGRVIHSAFYYTGFMVKAVLVSFWDLLTGRVGLDQMSGLVGISGELGAAAKRGLSDFLSIFGMLSINLGIVNLLPFPALDGGRILFLLVEAVRRKPIPPEREGLVHGIGFLLLILLAVVVNINDIFKLWS